MNSTFHGAKSYFKYRASDLTIMQCSESKRSLSVFETNRYTTNEIPLNGHFNQFLLDPLIRHMEIEALYLPLFWPTYPLPFEYFIFINYEKE
jgi:hypothetical protein